MRVFLVGAEPSDLAPGGEELRGTTGMIGLECSGRMNAARVARVARKARTSLLDGRPVRLFVTLDEPAPRNPAACIKSAVRVFERVQAGVGPVGEVRLGARLHDGVVEHVMWPTGDSGQSGVREPRRPRPDSDEGNQTVQPE
jgi:hypothetical protein